MNKQERMEHLLRKLEEMKQYETRLFDRGAGFIAGVDEVGRGPLAGPVVAAAVILPREFCILGIDDSKKVSPKKRAELAVLIRQEAIAYGIGFCDEGTIDEINILNATKRAMAEAVYEAEAMLGAPADHILLDALTLPDLPRPQTGIIRGDCLSVSIAAASILAKVTRDALMDDYSLLYPEYAFDKNKGYGTPDHFRGLAACGLCPIHRRSFLGNYNFPDGVK